jgi:hypothetical protein
MLVGLCRRGLDDQPCVGGAFEPSGADRGADRLPREGDDREPCAHPRNPGARTLPDGSYRVILKGQAAGCAARGEVLAAHSGSSGAHRHPKTTTHKIQPTKSRRGFSRAQRSNGGHELPPLCEITGQRFTGRKPARRTTPGAREAASLRWQPVGCRHTSTSANAASVSPLPYRGKEMWLRSC